MLTTKSVDSPIDRELDGLRILATRFRGRGMPASRYDVWMPSLGPSERLLKSAQTGKIAWAEFAREYRAELFYGWARRRAQPDDQKSRPEIYVAAHRTTVT
jgi:uncharacterized protein YeaO (DUF488 family)